MKKLSCLLVVLFVVFISSQAIAATYADFDAKFAKEETAVTTAKGEVQELAEMAKELGIIDSNGTRSKALLNDGRAILAAISGQETIFDGAFILEVLNH